jgi:long-chain acyl-CoA synthetase
MTRTFCQSVIEAAQARPVKVAMMAFGPRGVETITFGAMLDQVRSLAYRLTQEEIDFGDRVALLGENQPNWALAYLGTIYRGAVAVPLDPGASVEALANFIDNSESKLAFVSPASLGKLRAVCDRLGRQIRAVLLYPLEESNGLARFEDWAQTPRPDEFDFAPPPARPEDIALLIYTSGTTGTPKAVPLTHGNIYAECDGLQQAMRVTEQEVVFGILPLFHVYSQAINLWLATVIGARVVYMSGLSSEEIERGLKESQSTALLGVPRLWYLFHKKVFDAVRRQPAPLRWLFAAMMITNGWLRDRLNINAGRLFFKRVHDSFGGKLRLAVSGGASFDVKVARDFHKLGFTILQGYGLTETSAAATATRFEDNKIGSVGTPLDNVEVKIDSPDEEGIGEILIRGPIVTPGYYRNTEANREAFTADGWFRSGDLGRFDEQGHLYIVGRKKEVVKLPTGKLIYPDDVEAHYERTPLVSEICVLGVRDEASPFRGAEKLVAVVVPDFDYLRSHHIASAREAIRYELDNLGRQLPEHQRVRDYIIRAELLPRTTTRKVRRFELRKQIEALKFTARPERDVSQFLLTDADRALMDSIAGRAVADAILQQAPDARVIHPQMNLEIDLGLDSLARAEATVSIEHALGVEFKPEEAVAAFTVGEVVKLAESKISAAPPIKPITEHRPSQPDWREILITTPMDSPDLQPIIEPRPVAGVAVYLLLRVIYLAARVLFRLEVEGREKLTEMERPFLVCPNHQSFLDPIILCSTYPLGVLKHIFHVGASEYFTSPFMAWLARLLKIVPVDPDTNLMRAMKASAAGLRAGKILNLYPEGQRSFNGSLQEFKQGAAILATELDVPIVPVALDGFYRVWPRKSRRIHLAKVKIRFGEPILARGGARAILPEGMKGEAAYEKVTTVLKERIDRMLDEIRLP